MTDCKCVIIRLKFSFATILILIITTLYMLLLYVTGKLKTLLATTQSQQ